MRALLFGLIALVVAGTFPAHAENVLRWAAQGDSLTFDPYAQNEGPTFTHNGQIYEALVTRAPDLTLIPVLATSWEAVEPTVWEFHLREGVSFHNGSPFTADDVVFSIERAQHTNSQYAFFVEEISDVEVVDDYTVRMHTNEPVPLLPEQLYSIYIMSRSWSVANNVEEVQNFSAGEENYAVRHANGTGPFILDLREPGIRTLMSRNENWWGLAEDNPHNIDRIVFTPIANAATRVAALLSGELDLMLDPPLQDLRRIENTAGLKLESVPQVRTIFFGLDQASEELRSSDVEGANPFADVRVRRAMYQALNMDAVQSRLMRGYSVPAGQLVAPGIGGHDEELDTRFPYDPDASRALLAEAGYPDGFSVTLDCPNDRYVNDEEICQAVVSMLGQVGIDVTLDAQTKSLHFIDIENRVTDFYMLGWTPSTLDSGDTFEYLYITDGSWNAGGYSNTEFDALVDQINREVDMERRAELMHQAWQIVTDEVAYLPLHHQVLTWAMRDTLDMPITATNIPYFRWAHMSEE